MREVAIVQTIMENVYASSNPSVAFSEYCSKIVHILDATANTSIPKTAF